MQHKQQLSQIKENKSAHYCELPFLAYVPCCRQGSVSVHANKLLPSCSSELLLSGCDLLICFCSGDSWTEKSAGSCGHHHKMGRGCHLQSELPYSSRGRKAENWNPSCPWLEASWSLGWGTECNCVKLGSVKTGMLTVSCQTVPRTTLSIQNIPLAKIIHRLLWCSAWEERKEEGRRSVLLYLLKATIIRSLPPSQLFAGLLFHHSFAIYFFFSGHIFFPNSDKITASILSCPDCMKKSLIALFICSSHKTLKTLKPKAFEDILFQQKWGRSCVSCSHHSTVGGISRPHEAGWALDFTEHFQWAACCAALLCLFLCPRLQWCWEANGFYVWPCKGGWTPREWCHLWVWQHIHPWVDDSRVIVCTVWETLTYLVEIVLINKFIKPEEGRKRVI